MEHTNIFRGLNFNVNREESAFDLLVPYKEDFKSLTNNELILEITSTDAFLENEPSTLAALYKVFVVAPKLGNYRRQIITVIERRPNGRFPVEIFCHIDNDKKVGIESSQFLQSITDIFDKTVVKTVIEDLFYQSKMINSKGA